MHSISYIPIFISETDKLIALIPFKEFVNIILIMQGQIHSAY